MREQVLAIISRHLPGPFRQSGGGNVLTRCPFHKGGEERKPSFSIHLDRAVYHCFTCHQAGGIRHLLLELKVPRSTIDAELSTIQPMIEKQKELIQLQKATTFISRDPFKAKTVLPEAMLGIFDHEPPGLIEKGFDPELLKKMGVGFDKRLGRVTYPLRDMYGNLAGISGGLTKFSQETFPKYKVYQGGSRRWDGRWQEGDYGSWFDEEYPGYTCENHEFMWNFDRVLAAVQAMSEDHVTVYVVEGFKACLWMIQNGYPLTVALMGSYISDRQQQMLHRLGATVVLCLDNDEAGRRATLRVGDLLWNPLYGRVRVMQYPAIDEDGQPDDYPRSFLREMVEGSLRFPDHFHKVRKRSNATWR